MKNALSGAALCLTFLCAAQAHGQTVIAPGQNWTGSGALSATDARDEEGSPYDEFRFSVTAGRPIRISVIGNDELDTVLAVFGDGPTARVLATDDDSGGGLNPRLTFDPQTSGTYTVRVAGFAEDEMGSYEIRLESMAPVPAAVSAPTRTVAVTQTWRIFEGVISANDPEVEGRRFRDHRVRLATGESILVRLESSDFDPIVQILAGTDSDSNVLEADDDSGPGTNSMLLFEAPDAGDVIIRVTSYASGGAGRYTLRVASERE